MKKTSHKNLTIETKLCFAIAMKMAPLLLLVLLANINISHSTESEQVGGHDSYVHLLHVTGEKKGCSEEEGNVTCGGLSDLHNMTLLGSTAILLSASFTILNTVISFVGLAHIAIIGVAESNTIVECEQKHAGEMGADICFLSVQDITLKNVTFRRCGLLHNSTTLSTATENTVLLTRSALYLDNCVNVAFRSVHFVQSNGHGLTLFDTVGAVNISNCTFDSNSIAKWEMGLYPGGGGLYVEFSYCPPAQHGVCTSSNTRNNSNSMYLISKCIFTGNTAYQLRSEVDISPYARGTKSKFQGMGRGGAIGVFLRGHASNNTLHVEGCDFIQNSARFGGAVYVVLQDSTTNNKVLVDHSKFDGNKAVESGASGGGAVHIGLDVFDADPPQNNNLHFHNCCFTNNSALYAYGGGVGIFSSHVKQYSPNTLFFKRCFWLRNKAQFGAAVHISPDV